jgi:hypothetical protein
MSLSVLQVDQIRAKGQLTPQEISQRILKSCAGFGHIDAGGTTIA